MNFPKTYCAVAFNQIYSDNAGRYRLCCYAGNNSHIQKYNTQNTLPFDYFLSDEMETVRDKMMSGEKVSGCEQCYQMEELGFKSHRQTKYNAIYRPQLNVEKVSLKLRIMGSYCNLGCYMCHPYNSSTRRAELKQKDILWNSDDKVTPISTNRFEIIANNIVKNIHLVESIHVTGGEPLQLPRMWQLMDIIPDSAAKDISLVIDTNLTVISNIDKLILKFKRVSLSVSCDHYGDKLAWIRYPINVETFYSNISTLKHLISNINVTVSILNINDLIKIKERYNEYNPTFDNVNVNPSMLSIRNLPPLLKDQYINKYSEHVMVVQELRKSVIPGELNRGLKYCNDINAGRDINFNQTFADLLSIL